MSIMFPNFRFSFEHEVIQYLQSRPLHKSSSRECSRRIWVLFSTHLTVFRAQLSDCASVAHGEIVKKNRVPLGIAIDRIKSADHLHKGTGNIVIRSREIVKSSFLEAIAIQLVIARWKAPCGTVARRKSGPRYPGLCDSSQSRVESISSFK